MNGLFEWQDLQNATLACCLPENGVVLELESMVTLFSEYVKWSRKSRSLRYITIIHNLAMYLLS